MSSDRDNSQNQQHSIQTLQAKVTSGSDKLTDKSQTTKQQCRQVKQSKQVKQGYSAGARSAKKSLCVLIKF